MCEIPVEVTNEETVVRALRECHVRKGKLRENVFRPQVGTDLVSMMRHTHMGSRACKEKAKEIAGGDKNNPYVGFAAITVQAVRDLGADVVDSREEYCGHADLKHGVVVQPDEPLDPVLSLRLRAMNNKAKLHEDPNVDAEDWTGTRIE